MTGTSAFREGKAAADLWLAGKPPRGNYWPMPPDANIAELIRTLNALPFLYTHACCGGHIRTKKAVRELLVGGVSARALQGDAEFGCYSGPWFSFDVDGSERGDRFVRELRLLLSRLKGASLKNLPGGERTWGVQITCAEGSAPATTFAEARRKERLGARRIARILALTRTHLV